MSHTEILKILRAFKEKRAEQYEGNNKCSHKKVS